MLDLIPIILAFALIIGLFGWWGVLATVLVILFFVVSMNDPKPKRKLGSVERFIYNLGLDDEDKI